MLLQRVFQRLCAAKNIAVTTSLLLKPPARGYVVPLRPKRLKYAKFHKCLRGVRPRRPDVVHVPKLRFASYGIYAKEASRITPSQLESSRLVLLRTIGKAKTGAKIILRVFPHIPVTKKPLEVRMGKGKGAVDHFVSFVRAGSMLFEFNCSNSLSAKKAYKAMKYKLPIDIGFIGQTQKQAT